MPIYSLDGLFSCQLYVLRINRARSFFILYLNRVKIIHSYQLLPAFSGSRKKSLSVIHERPRSLCRIYTS